MTKDRKIRPCHLEANHEGPCVFFKPGDPDTPIEELVMPKLFASMRGGLVFKTRDGRTQELRCTIDDVRGDLELRERKDDKDNVPVILYSTISCWWTHEWSHATEKKEAEGVEVMRGIEIPIPHAFLCDPIGGLLLYTTGWRQFLDAAERDPSRYGRHGMRAFTAAHHLNTVKSRLDRTPWAFRGWGEYERLLDEHDRMTAPGHLGS